jgi:hypothetical protein
MPDRPSFREKALRVEQIAFLFDLINLPTKFEKNSTFAAFIASACKEDAALSERKRSIMSQESVLCLLTFLGNRVSTKVAEGAIEDWVRMTIPSDVMGRYLAILQSMMSAEWRNPDEMAEVLLKELSRYDLQHMYSRFMATCLLFWIAPEEMRKGGRFDLDREHDEVFKKAERSFNVMWIAYERWMARGFTHYTDVLSSLGKFYSELRWGANLQRRPEGFVSGIDYTIAKGAYVYLEEVRSLVKQSYADFESEIEPILEKLRPVDSDKAL